jgi:hypothetical protein
VYAGFGTLIVTVFTSRISHDQVRSVVAIKGSVARQVVPHGTLLAVVGQGIRSEACMGKATTPVT